MAAEAFEYLDIEDLLDLAHPDVWSKAAALLHSIVNNHPLVDGNKRLGWLATAVFLDLNGIEIAVARNDDVYDLVMAVAASDIDVVAIASALQHLLS